MIEGAGLGIPAVICHAPAEPPPRSVRWCAGWHTAAGGARGLLATWAAAAAGPWLEPAGEPWTCGR